MGMIEPLHYIFIVVDGRRPSYSAGLEMKAFAQLFVDYGCKVAYNLDGGGSSEMYYNNKVVNVPDDGQGYSKPWPGTQGKRHHLYWVGVKRYEKTAAYDCYFYLNIAFGCDRGICL